MNTYIKKIILITLPLLTGMFAPLHAVNSAEDAFEQLMFIQNKRLTAAEACMTLPGLRTKDQGKKIDFSYILSTKVDVPMFNIIDGNLKDLAVKTCKTVWEQEATKTSKYSPEQLDSLAQLREKLGILSLSDKIRSALTLGASGCEKIGKLGRTLSALPASTKESTMKSCGWYFLGLTSKGKADTDAPRHPKAYEAVRTSTDKEDATTARERITKNKYDWQRWLIQKDYKLS